MQIIRILTSELKKLLEARTNKTNESSDDEIAAELSKLDGRLLPISGGTTKLSSEGTLVVAFSLKLQETLSVLLEPTMDELLKDEYEQNLKDIISVDPEVPAGPKEYPNECLSRILLDNYPQLLKLTTLYFNLSLSSLVTRFMVNLVYKLECWEVYHLLQAMPTLEYFLQLIGFDIITTPFGHIVKPPENFLGFNLRQGLQYTFPFPFYNYSYHSTRPEARLEKYRKVSIEPYVDIRLNKSSGKKRARNKIQRFSSAVAERVLEGGFFLNNPKMNMKKPKDIQLDAHYTLRILTPSEIDFAYFRYFPKDDDEIDVDSLDDDEDFESPKNYFSDDEARMESMLTKRYKFVSSRFTNYLNGKKPIKSKKTPATQARARKSESIVQKASRKSSQSRSNSTAATKPLEKSTKFNTESTLEETQQYPYPVFNTLLTSNAVVNRPEAPKSKASTTNYNITSPHNNARQRSSVSTGSSTIQGKPSIESSATSSSKHTAPTSIRKESISTRMQIDPRSDTAMVGREVPQLPSQPIPQRKTSSVSKGKPPTKSQTDAPNRGPPAWTPTNTIATPSQSIGHSRSASQYSMTPGYQNQAPMRQSDSNDQTPQTGQPVAQIVTLPTYGMPPYNPYSNWLAPQMSGDKSADQKALDQQALLMSYQKYGYPDQYNPYVSGYPATYGASMYQRPDQMYYTTGASNMGYNPQGAQNAYTQLYPYISPMYQPQYHQQQMPTSSINEMSQGRKRKSLAADTLSSKKVSNKDKSAPKKP